MYRCYWWCERAVAGRSTPRGAARWQCSGQNCSVVSYLWSKTYCPLSRVNILSSRDEKKSCRTRSRLNSVPRKYVRRSWNSSVNTCTEETSTSSTAANTDTETGESGGDLTLGGQTRYFDPHPRFFLERNIFWYTPTRNLRHDYIILCLGLCFLLSSITDLWTARNVALMILTSQSSRTPGCTN